MQGSGETTPGPRARRRQPPEPTERQACGGYSERSGHRPVRRKYAANNERSRSTAAAPSARPVPADPQPECRQGFFRTCCAPDWTPSHTQGTAPRPLATMRITPHSKNTRSTSNSLRCGNRSPISSSHRTTVPDHAMPPRRNPLIALTEFVPEPPRNQRSQAGQWPRQRQHENRRPAHR